MKLNLFDRILLVFLLIIAALGSLGLAAGALHLIPPETMCAWTQALFTNGTARLVAGLLALVVLLIVVRLLLRKKEKEPAYVEIALGEDGKARISVDALKGLAQKHCLQNSSIRECETKIIQVEGGILLEVQLMLLPDAKIPGLAIEIRNSLKEYVESVSGISVKDVKLLFLNHANAQEE